jgi:hypothetical protein
VEVAIELKLLLTSSTHYWAIVKTDMPICTHGTPVRPSHPRVLLTEPEALTAGLR